MTVFLRFIRSFAPAFSLPCEPAGHSASLDGCRSEFMLIVSATGIGPSTGWLEGGGSMSCFTPFYTRKAPYWEDEAWRANVHKVMEVIHDQLCPRAKARRRRPGQVHTWVGHVGETNCWLCRQSKVGSPKSRRVVLVVPALAPFRSGDLAPPWGSQETRSMLP